MISLGVNYDLKRFVTPTEAAKLAQFERKLADEGIGFSYSTPDLVCVDITDYSPQIINTLFPNQSWRWTNQHRIA